MIQDVEQSGFRGRLVAAELRGPSDDLGTATHAHLGDLVVVGGDHHSVDRRRVPGLLQSVGDQRLAGQGPYVLARDGPSSRREPE